MPFPLQITKLFKFDQSDDSFTMADILNAFPNLTENELKNLAELKVEQSTIVDVGVGITRVR